VTNLSLVKGQGNELEKQIEQAKADSLASQLALVHISTDQSFSIKAMDGETKPEPEHPMKKTSQVLLELQLGNNGVMPGIQDQKSPYGYRWTTTNFHQTY
jgi:hypothetical protein